MALPLSLVIPSPLFTDPLHKYPRELYGHPLAGDRAPIGAGQSEGPEPSRLKAPSLYRGAEHAGKVVGCP